MPENLNRQGVLNFLDTLYAGDVEGALAHCSDDIAFAANAPVDILPHMGSHRGKAAIRKMWLFRRALRGADDPRRGRQGRGAAPRFLPQARQRADGAVRSCRLLHTARWPD